MEQHVYGCLKRGRKCAIKSLPHFRRGSFRRIPPNDSLSLASHGGGKIGLPLISYEVGAATEPLSPAAFPAFRHEWLYKARKQGKSRQHSKNIHFLRYHPVDIQKTSR
jgi:hypothetical protein